MIKSKLKYRTVTLYLFLALSAFMLAGLAGCSDNTVSGTGNLSVSSGSDSRITGNNPASILQIFEAKVMINDLKINPDGDEREESAQHLKIGPFVISLNLDSNITLVTNVSIPPGNYRKIKFEIHRLQPNDIIPDSDFVDVNGRYSVVVKGAFNGVAFTYKSTVTANQQIYLQKKLAVLAISAGPNITFFASPMTWFYDSNGTLLDPTIAGNRSIIEDNIKDNLKNHIRIFVDNDRDGKPDN